MWNSGKLGEGLAVGVALEGESDKCRRRNGVRGLVEDMLERSQMTCDGILVMEAIGQIPGNVRNYLDN